MFKPSKEKAQSTVEYIILVTAVISVAIYFLVAGGRDGAPFQKRMSNTMDILSVQMTNAASRMANTP